MNADEIAQALRESLPPKIDYAELVGAEGFAHGCCYVWDDPLPYLMSNAADLIESLQAENAALRSTQPVEISGDAATSFALAAELSDVKAQLAESQRRERAAVEDLNGTGACFTCKHFRRNGGDCFGAGRCRLDGIEIWPCNEPGVYRVEVPDDGRKTYEWRGPQEAGKGAEK